MMNQLELTNEQLDFLKFIVQDFEYNDDKERNLINQIEAKIYDLQETELLRTMNILKAQAKRPTMEWQIMEHTKGILLECNLSEG